MGDGQRRCPAAGKRSVGQPAKRWSDDIEKSVSKIQGARPGDWRLLAEDRAEWKSMEEQFRKRGG